MCLIFIYLAVCTYSLIHLLTDSQSRKLSKIMKRVNITYDNPKKYKGPHVEGWPPGKDRYMPNYIQPDHDTFPIRPSKAHFKGIFSILKYSLYLKVPLNVKIVQQNIFHFKAFGMINLHFEIRICQKIYNRVTMKVYVKCVVRFNVHKTLSKFWSKRRDFNFCG